MPDFHSGYIGSIPISRSKVLIMTEQQLKDAFLGKKVRVINVETPFDKRATVCGVCTFIGRNILLKKDQVTVDRMPIFLKSFDQVSLYV
jgi:hypothetical protein